jgi:hypothetical protein
MAISSADRKRYIAKKSVSTQYEPPIGLYKAEQTKKKISEEKTPTQDNIVNPYNKEICQICEYSGKERGEWYCYQDEPIVRCYRILNCSRYRIADESITTSFPGRDEESENPGL